MDSKSYKPFKDIPVIMILLKYNIGWLVGWFVGFMAYQPL